MPRKAERVKLSDAYIEKFATEKKDDAVWDSEVDGFGFRCRNGTKTFVFRYSIGGRGGRQYRMTLGSAGTVMYAPLHTPERTPLKMTTRQTNALHSQKQQPDVAPTVSTSF